MAKKTAVWGIDIGQSALKALRCTVGDNGTIEADKFDFIEYPKILSSPEADAEELIQDALKQFLSRNKVVGDKVAISVSGQAGLSRFFKPPPVEIKTLPDIVRYEVKQQIPFPIDDVIWDWQQLGGTVVEGRAIDAEVGLFAMKRDAVFRALRPFQDADIDVDLLQLSPLALYNYVCFDVIEKLPKAEEFDPDNPPPSIVVMAIGTDTTDLVVTNGLKLWLRSIPIGGNHFTRQLSRELKLTQAKAEHLKRNARQSENPKAVFQAMRPVFNDLVNEVQRSLTFFQSMEKNAQITEIQLLGNAAKLPGLRQFLSTQLEIDIAKSSDFRKLGGTEVTKQPAFENNLLSFAPCYGLCLQGLKKGTMNTNLLPQEIVVARLIEAKKPWVLASVGLLMLGMVLGLFFKANALQQVDPLHKDSKGVTWESSFKNVNAEVSKSTNFKTKDDSLKKLLSDFKTIGKELSSASEAKATWIDVYSAIYQSLPKDPRIQALYEKFGESASADPKEIPFEDREELYIDHIDSVYFTDLAQWYTPVMKSIHENQREKGIADLKTSAAPAVDPAAQTTPAAETGAVNPLAGKAGWVIEIRGNHFHNSEKQIQAFLSGDSFLRKRFLEPMLSRDDIVVPTGDDIESKFSLSDIGIFFPTITAMTEPIDYKITYDPLAGTASTDRPAGGGGGRGMAGMGSVTAGGGRGAGAETPAESTENVYDTKIFRFVIQFAWIPQTPAERQKARELRLEEIKKKEEEKKAAENSAVQEPGQ